MRKLKTLFAPAFKALGFGRRRERHYQPPQRHRRLRAERLEDRRLLTVLECTASSGSFTWDRATPSWWNDYTQVFEAWDNVSTAVFPNAPNGLTVTIDNTLPIVAYGLTFDGGTVTIGGAALGLALAPSATTVPIDVIGANTTATINSNITGDTGAAPAKADAGTFLVGGGFSVPGGISIAAGKLEVAAGSSVSTAGSVTLSGGQVKVDSTGALYAHGLSLTDGATLSGSGAINLGTGGLAYASSATSTFAGGITSTGACQIDTSAGGLTLTGNNTFNNEVTVTSGRLEVDGTITAPSVNIDNASVLAGSGIYHCDGNGDGLYYGSSAASTFAAVSGAGGIEVDKGGSLKLTGQSTYTRETDTTWGTLMLACPSDDTLPRATTVQFSDDYSATLDLFGTYQTVAGLNAAQNNTRNHVIGNSSTTSDSRLTYAGGTTASTYAGKIQDQVGSGSQTVALVVSSGELRLGAPPPSVKVDTYTGGTVVNGGRLVLEDDAAMGSVSASLVVDSPGVVDLHDRWPEIGWLGGNGTITNEGSSLSALTLYNANSDRGVFGGKIVDHIGVGGTGQVALWLTGDGTLVIDGLYNDFSGGTRIDDGALQLGDEAGNGLLTGNIDAGEDDVEVIFDVSATVPPSTLVFPGTITNAISVTKTGAGKLELLPDGGIYTYGINTYRNGTTVQAGTMQFGVGARGDGLPGGNLDIYDGSVVDIGGVDMTTTGITAFHKVTLHDGSIIDTGTTAGTMVANSEYDVYTGSVSAKLAGAVRLNKEGSGTVTLNAPETCTGNITVDAGTLLFGSAGAVPSGANLIVNAGTVDLGTLTTVALTTATLNGGTITNGTLTASTAFNVYNGTISANLAGSAALNESGTGTVTISGHGTFVGGTLVTGATLILLTADAITPGKSVIVSAGGSIVCGLGTSGGDSESQSSGNSSETATSGGSSPQIGTSGGNSTETDASGGYSTETYTPSPGDFMYYLRPVSNPSWDEGNTTTYTVGGSGTIADPYVVVIGADPGENTAGYIDFEIYASIHGYNSAHASYNSLSQAILGVSNVPDANEPLVGTFTQDGTDWNEAGTDMAQAGAVLLNGDDQQGDLCGLAAGYGITVDGGPVTTDTNGVGYIGPADPDLGAGGSLGDGEGTIIAYAGVCTYVSGSSPPINTPNWASPRTWSDVLVGHLRYTFTGGELSSGSLTQLDVSQVHSGDVYYNYFKQNGTAHVAEPASSDEPVTIVVSLGENLQSGGGGFSTMNAAAVAAVFAGPGSAAPGTSVDGTASPTQAAATAVTPPFATPAIAIALVTATTISSPPIGQGLCPEDLARFQPSTAGATAIQTGPNFAAARAEVFRDYGTADSTPNRDGDPLALDAETLRSLATL